MNQDYLQHHGILGMKWGVRRTPEQLGRRSSGKTKSSKPKKEKAQKSTKRKVAEVAVSAGALGLSAYMMTHPGAMKKGASKVQNFLRKSRNVSPSERNIYSDIINQNASMDEIRRAMNRVR